jgi:hypothetical protein
MVTNGFRRADGVIAIQEAEAAMFRHQLEDEASRVWTIGHMPPGVTTGRLVGGIFAGSSFIANVQSITYFHREGPAAGAQKLPKFRFVVVGTSAVAFSTIQRP